LFLDGGAFLLEAPLRSILDNTLLVRECRSGSVRGKYEQKNENKGNDLIGKERKKEDKRKI
jgi:hypothetical protein